MNIIKQFDNAVAEKSINKLFLVATKIARKHAYQYSLSITYDWELAADDVVLNLIDFIQKENWKHPSNYYYGFIKKQVYWKYIAVLKNEPVVSLEAQFTNSENKEFFDQVEVRPVIPEPTYEEEIEQKAVQEIIRLADEFKSRKEIMETLGIDKHVFIKLVNKWKIQFDMHNTEQLIENLKIRNIYLENNGDLKAVRKVIGIRKPAHAITSAVRKAEEAIKLLHKKPEIFMNRFVLPPNRSSVWDKSYYSIEL